MANRSIPPKVGKKIHPDLFLRKFLKCPICGRGLTGAPSKGNGGVYYYYHCSAKYSHFSCRADDANTSFAKYVAQLKPNETVVTLYAEILKDINGERIKTLRKRGICLEPI